MERPRTDDIASPGIASNRLKSYHYRSRARLAPRSVARQCCLTKKTLDPDYPKNGPVTVDWDEHFAWPKTQAALASNPVDDLRAQEQR
jgi:hypothetical protein